MKKLHLFILLFCVLAHSAWSEPKTTIMYYDADMETKFSGAFRSRQYPWPVLRIGVAHNKDRHFAMVRIQVNPKARRSEVMRQLVDAAVIAFRLDPKLQQADLDAVVSDDTSTAKAEPLYAVSLKRQQVATFRPTVTPESWLKQLNGLDNTSPLLPDRDPIQVTTDSIIGFYNDSLLRLPIYKSKPTPSASPAKQNR